MRYNSKSPLWTPLKQTPFLCAFAGDGGSEEDPPAGGGGGGGTPPAGTDGKPPAKAADKDGTPETHEVIVNGKKVEMTLDELKEHATKGAGADEKFRQASELRKTAERGIRLDELAHKMADEGDAVSPADLNEFITLLGGDPADLDMSKMTPNQPPTGQSNTSDPNKTNPQGTQPLSVVKKEQLDPDVQRVLNQANEAELSRIRENIVAETRKGIDNDSVLGKLIDELPEDTREEVKSELYDMAEERVRNQIVLENKPFGPQMVQEVAQVLRSRIKRLGIPSTPRGGQLPTSASGPGMGYGNQQVLPDKPVERVSSTDPDYIEKTTQRVQQNLNKLAMGRK